MGTYLLFGEGRRLERVANVPAGPFGSVDPLAVFFPSDDDRVGFRGIEVDPKILQGVRPPVFEALTMHALLGMKGLEIDQAAEMQGRVQVWTIEGQENLVLALAQQLGSLNQAETILGELTQRHQAMQGKLVDQLGKARQELFHLQDGTVKVQLPQVLVDLAGKIIPL